jgi:peptidoglycan hydrolase-like protein with peptidoglycan-binding domain
MRARNMQVLTDQLKEEYPGVVIYGIGDKPHQSSPSDHNEDDTPGSKSEQTDADNNPEHRAIDVMLGPKFSKNDAELLVANLVLKNSNKKRLRYVIWNGCIWSSTSNFVEKQYPGKDKHTNHVHVSGLAANDEDESPWDLDDNPWGHTDAPPVSQPPVNTIRELHEGVKGEDVGRLQTFFRNNFPIYRQFVNVKRGQLIAVDNDFGPQTKAWVIEFQRRTGLARDGVVGPNTRERLARYGYKP